MSRQTRVETKQERRKIREMRGEIMRDDERQTEREGGRGEKGKGGERGRETVRQLSTQIDRKRKIEREREEGRR